MSARILIVLLLYLIPCILNAQNEGKECMLTEEFTADSLKNTQPEESKFLKTSKNIFNKAVDWFNATDTTYILPNKYNLTFMLEQSTWFEHYRLGISGENGNQVLGFAPKVNTKLGLYFGLRCIFLGFSLDLSSLFNKERE